jgi:membrane protein DedA with SNARE-associated domain
MFDAELLHRGYAFLFLGVMLEADGVLLAGAFLAARGYFDIRAVILVSALASVLANQFWFRLARFRGQSFFERKIQADRRFHRISGWLQRREGVLIFFSRFLYGFRVAIPAAYGATGLPAARFTWIDAVSAGVWSVVVGFAGFALGDVMRAAIHDLRQYEWLVVLAIASVVALVVAGRQGSLRVVVAAVRKPIDLSSDSALRLLTLVRHAARLLVVHPHGRVALLVTSLGILNITTAIFHTRLVHVRWLASALPFDVSRGSRALMLLAGVGLVYLARGLARRKRLAWILGFGMTAVSALFYLGQNVSILRASLAVLLAWEMWRHRRRFHARTDPIRLRHALVAALVLAVALSIYGVVGLRQVGHPSPDILVALKGTWLAASFVRLPYYEGIPSAEAFVMSLRLLFLLSLGYVVTAALASVAWRRHGRRTHNQA